MKNRMEEPAGKLKLSEVPKKPWLHLMVDFITKLLVVAGKDAILVVCDRLSKMTHFVAMTEGTMAEGLIRLFWDNVWKLHGLPESVVSDRGLQFAAELTKELNRMLGIRTKLSTTFHPQTDGQTEQMNQELEQYLQFFIEYRQKDWPEWLAAAEFAVNNKVYTATVKYQKQVEGQKKILPPPVKVASEKEYEVEEILDRQERRGKMKYLIK